MINFIQENLLLVFYIYMVFITMFAVCSNKLTINNIAWAVVTGLLWPILIPAAWVCKVLKV